MQSLWDELSRRLGEPGAMVRYVAGWSLILVLLGDTCLQALPVRFLRRSQRPVKPVAKDGKLIAFAPTSRLSSASQLFSIGCHLLVAAGLGSLWVVLGYRDSCVPLLEALLLVPLMPLREPAVGVAIVTGVVLIWSGFRFRSLWPVSLAGFALIDVGWVFYVGWVCVAKPFDLLARGRCPNIGLISWARQVWESAWKPTPGPHSFLVLGTTLFLMGIPVVYLSFRQPWARRKRLFSIIYVVGARGRSPKQPSGAKA